MLKKIMFLGIVFLFVWSKQNGYAQSCSDISVTETTPSTTLSPCTPVSYFEYTISNSNSSLTYSSVTATVHLPLGISFVSFNSSLSTPGISTSSTAGTTDPVFTIPSIPASGNVTIKIVAQTPCTPDITTRPVITGLDISSSSLGTCAKTVTNTITIATPVLSVTNVNPLVVNANTGDISELVFFVQNPSSAGNIPVVNINCSPDGTTQLQGYGISTTSSVFTGTYLSIGTGINITGTTIQTLLGNTFTGLGPGQGFYVHIKYKVISCNNATNGAYTFSWGCGTSTCQSITMTTDINSFSGDPILNVTTLSTFTNSSYCPGGGPSIPMGFIYTNNGTTLTGTNAPPPGNAKAIDLVLYIGVTNSLGSINPNTMKINGNTTVLPYGTVVTLDLVNSTTAYNVWKIDLTQLSTSLFSMSTTPFGPNTLSDIDGDGAIDDMAEGGNHFTLTMDYTYASTCPVEFASCNNEKDMGISTQEKYQNQCNSIPTSDVRVTPYSATNTADSYYLYSSVGQNATASLPTDVLANTPFLYTICPRFHETWAPQGFDFNCPSGYDQFNITLPPGYHVNLAALTPAVNGGTIPILLTPRCSGSPTTVNATVTEYPPVSSTPGYILINLGRIPTNQCGPYNETDLVPCFDVPLTLDCSSNPATQNFGFDNISYSLQYVCDPSCSTCANNIVCASANTYHHCFGPCSKPFSTDTYSFTFKRTNLGLLNTSSQYDCNNIGSAIPVPSASSVLRLDRAYPGDKIEATLKGGFSGANGSAYTSMFMQVRYNQLSITDVNSTDIFIQDPATPSTIYVSSLSNPSINGTYTLTYSFTANTPAEMNFKLPATLLPLLTTTDVRFDADLHLIAKTGPLFTASNTFYSPGPHPIIALRAEFGGTSPIFRGDTVKSCDSWGAPFTMLQPTPSFSYYPSTVYNENSDCSPFLVNFNYHSIGAMWSSGQDDFPGEFRPYSALDNNVVITLPPGYVYTGTDFGILTDGYGNPANNYFNGVFTYPATPVTPVSITTSTSGTTLTYNGINSTTPCWPLLDSKYWYAVQPQYSLTVYMQPKCDAPATDAFTAVSGYTQNTQQSNTIYQDHFPINLTAAPVHHINPSLHITAPPIVEAYSNTVTFDFTDCNTNAHGAPNAWVAFQSPGGTLSFTSVTAPPSTTALPTIPYSGGILVNVGNIPGSVCENLRLTATVTGVNCSPGPDSVLVQWGNECTAPAISTLESLCAQGSTYFHFNRYNSDLNLLTPVGFPTTPVELCGDSIKYTFTIANPDLGTVTDPTFWMELPAGITLQDAIFTYPYSSSSPVYTTTPINAFGSSGTDPGWHLNSLFSSIYTNGLTGSATSPNNQVGVTVTVRTSCGYDPNNFLKFFTGGISSCSQPIAVPPAEHRPSIINASVPDDLDISVSTSDTALNCTDNGLITITVTNNSSSSTTNHNIITATVPGILTVTGITPAALSNTLVSGNRIITWSLPVLAGSGSQAFTFNAGLNSSAFCGQLSIDVVNIYTDSIYCPSTHTSCSVSDTSTAIPLTFNACCGCEVNAGPDVIICNGASTTLSATGGITYTWMPGSITGQTITVSPASTTTYTVTTTNTDEGTCTDVVTVTVNPAISASVSNTSIACYGGSAGSVTVSASGGTPAYSYLWSPTGGTGNVASPLSPGTYTVTVTDSRGCTNSQAFSITQPPLLSVQTYNQTNVSCNGGHNGSATITITGGTLPYTYSWSPSGGTAATASGLAAGTYTATATDANGCTVSHVFTITQLSALAVTSHPQTNVLCNGAHTGTATVNVTGGTGFYFYSWSPSGGTASTATGLAAGSYTCTVTDVNGCSITQTFTITQPPALSVSVTYTPIACNGGRSDQATATVSGGTPGYTYSWAPTGGTNSTANLLLAGTYTVTVTDANGCVVNQVFTITQPAALTIPTHPQTNILCNGAHTGSATVVPAGGTTPYTYVWTPLGGTAATATGLGAGNYTCTVTDHNGCIATQTFSITQPNAITLTPSQTPVLCNGGSTGTATIAATGGVSPFTYSWAPSGGTGSTATGLAAGTYTCTVTDHNGCTATQTVTVTQPAALTIPTHPQTNVLCNGAHTGTATVAPSGGTTPYTYSWAPSGGTAATATGLAANTYTCTVTDHNGCTASYVFTITQPSAFILGGGIVNVSCFGAHDGIASALISGGTSPYTYSWAPSGGTGSNATGLAPNTYTCTITDHNGCTATETFTITQPAVLSISSHPQTNVLCNGAHTGSATVVPAGGTTPYTYSWAPSGGTAATATGLAAGNYTCTVTDHNGCITTQAFTITQPATALTIPTHPQTNVLCNGAHTGSATVTPSGGVTPYTYNWLPSGGTAATATGLGAGTYTCTVTDNNGCTATQAFTITQTAAISMTVTPTNVSCNGGHTGSATVTSTTGGTPSYTYLWSTGSTGTSTTHLVAGTYTVTATDANGCTGTQTVVVTQPTALTLSFTGVHGACNGPNGYATASPSGGTTAYTYSWSSGATTATATGLAAGTYTCTVTDAHSCTITGTVSIGTLQPPCNPQGLAAYSPTSMIQVDEEMYFNAAPNPFNTSTTLKFEFQHREQVSLKIFDITGKEIIELYKGEADEGQSHAYEFNGTDLPSGLYIAELKSAVSGKSYHVKIMIQH